MLPLAQAFLGLNLIQSCLCESVYGICSKKKSDSTVFYCPRAQPELFLPSSHCPHGSLLNDYLMIHVSERKGFIGET